MNFSYYVDVIKNSVSAIDVANAIGWEVKHGRCRCPIHNGGDRNCRLYSGNRGFHCFSCGASGDVIKLVQQYYSMSFKDCIAWFNSTFNLGLNLGRNISPDERRQAEMAMKRRRMEIDFIEWKKRMSFDLSLTADEIVRKLEEIRDDNVPKTPDEPWNVAFRMAVCLLPEARRFAEDAAMNCIETKTG